MTHFKCLIERIVKIFKDILLRPPF